MVHYTARFDMQKPPPEGVPLRVEGEKWMAFSIYDLDVTKCKLTISHEGKLSLSLKRDDFFVDCDVITTASFGALNDLSCEW